MLKTILSWKKILTATLVLALLGFFAVGDATTARADASNASFSHFAMMGISGTQEMGKKPKPKPRPRPKDDDDDDPRPKPKPGPRDGDDD